MNYGEFKKWCEENGVTDDTEFCFWKDDSCTSILTSEELEMHNDDLLIG